MIFHPQVVARYILQAVACLPFILSLRPASQGPGAPSAVATQAQAAATSRAMIMFLSAIRQPVVAGLSAPI